MIQITDWVECLGRLTWKDDLQEWVKRNTE